MLIKKINWRRGEHSISCMMLRGYWSQQTLQHSIAALARKIKALTRSTERGYGRSCPASSVGWEIRFIWSVNLCRTDWEHWFTSASLCSSNKTWPLPLKHPESATAQICKPHEPCSLNTPCKTLIIKKFPQTKWLYCWNWTADMLFSHLRCQMLSKNRCHFKRNKTPFYAAFEP